MNLKNGKEFNSDGPWGVGVWELRSELKNEKKINWRGGMGEKGFGGHLRIVVLEASYLNPYFCRVYYWGHLRPEVRGLVCV